MEELYKTLGDAKCVELSKKSRTFWDMLKLSESRKNAPVGGAVRESMARDFIREFLPPGFGLKSGLVFDTSTRKMSPQCDAIIYKGVPLLEFTDVVVVDKEQVKAIFEIKTSIDQPLLFGVKRQGIRKPDSRLAYGFKRRRDFLPSGAKCILFAFSLFSSSTDDKVIERLNRICDYYGSYGVILRWEPKREKKPNIYNFDNSVSRLIEYLRNLS